MKDHDIILFPGGSKYSKKWAEDFREILDRDARHVYYVRYENWTESDDRFEIHKENDDADRELRRSDKYGIVAYHEGCAVALQSIANGRAKPKFIVFIGFPYEWSKSMNYDDEIRSWLHKVNVPTLFIQQNKDPQIEREELRELVESSVDKFKLEVIWDDSDGKYDDLWELKKLISDFIR